VVLVYDSGPFGIPGLSTTMTSISAESLPYSFFAVMVYFPESCLVEESIRKLVLSLVVCAKILLVSGSLTVFLVHSTTGIGAPDKGIWILIGSPARTLIFLPMRPSKYSFGFSLMGLAVMATDVSLGLPWPAALMAVTRYSY